MTTNRASNGLAYRVLVAALVVAGVAFVLFVFWRFVTVLLLIFAAVLFAILLSALALMLAEKTRLRRGAALATVIASLLLLVIALGTIAAPRISEQAAELRESLPRSWEQVQKTIENSEWGSWILDNTGKDGEGIPGGQEMLARVPRIFSTTVGALAQLLFVVFVGIYLAVRPDTYAQGLLKLFPISYRKRIAEVLGSTGYMLQWWLIGQAIIMAMVGVATGVGLALLGIPLAMILGIIAALFEFIPNIGPIIASIPAILMGFLISPAHALYVAILYTAIQQVESYVITPLIHRKTVSLEPALTISAQVGLGLTLGWLGLILATPLTAAALVVTKMLYIEDTLGDGVELEIPEEAKSRIEPSKEPA